MKKYNYTDYFDKYDRIMQFNKNKKKYIHGWYPFVEGYSKEFIKSILDELDFTPKHCMDPFSGSGTTAVELQKYNIKCTSFEVNPFMFNLAKSKMRTDYTITAFKTNLEFLKKVLLEVPIEIERVCPPPIYKSIVEKKELQKWIFDLEVMRGLLDIKYAINKIRDKKYRQLFKVPYAAIFLEVSNVYRNGKCLSYKKNLKTKVSLSREDVQNLFLNKLEEVIYPDILKINKLKQENGKLFSNYTNIHLGDSRESIDKIENNSVDLVITSPPYLNSRDYTDTYMIELWMLDLVSDYSELKKLRRNTFRSHVQVAWEKTELLDISELKKALNELETHRDQFWNKRLPEMIKGYFLDMNTLIESLSEKVKSGGKVYINVANSAYYGVEIEVDKIIATIGTLHRFEILEIRKARKINPSSQQKEKIPYLLEVVIVMNKK